MLPPYRVSFYNALADRCDLTVILDTVVEFDRQWAVNYSDCRFAVKVMNSHSFVLTRHHRDAAYEEKRQLHLSEKTFFVLRGIQPDVVASAEFGLRSSFSLAYARTKRIPFVLISEGTMRTEGWAGWKKTRIRRVLTRAADRIWTNGSESRELLVAYGAQTDRIDEGMTGIATRDLRDAICSMLSKRDALRSAMGLHGTVFLFAASLTPRKGLTNMLNAFSRIAGERRDLSLILAGGGELDSTISEWKCNHSDIPLHAPGFLEPTGMLPLFAAADWGILPTLDDNWSLATLEMLAAGLPQLFSRYNGASADLCHEGVTGYAFDPTDSDDFARVLNLALTSPLVRLDSRAVDKVVEHYSPDAQAERAMASIQNAIDARARMS